MIAVLIMRAQVIAHNRFDSIQPMVLGTVIPQARQSQDDLPRQFMREESGMVVVFLPDALAHYASVLANQRYSINLCWNVERTLYSAYHTWDLPELDLPHTPLDSRLRSQLWIPLHAMNRAFGSILEGEEPQTLYTLFVSSTEAFLSAHSISHDDLMDLQIAYACAEAHSGRANRYWSTEQLEQAKEQAQCVGSMPWMQGVWPQRFNQEEEDLTVSINIVGGFVFDIDKLGTPPDQQEGAAIPAD